VYGPKQLAFVYGGISFRHSPQVPACSAFMGREQTSQGFPAKASMLLQQALQIGETRKLSGSEPHRGHAAG
jgi:hypothetical protein